MEGKTAMKKLALALAISLVIYSILAGIGGAKGSLVYAIRVEGTIDAGVSNFIVNSINKAARENTWLIIELDTPGGLLSATEETVKRMLDSDAKTVVWVTPVGRWAYSAGTFILLASNVAVMDNATVIGAAQPRPADPKVIAAMAEWIEEIAAARHRSPQVARSFVENNRTMGPEEALRENVINLRASNYRKILENLGLADAEVRPLEMGLLEKALRFFSHPDVVMILFILGFYGIFFEIITPGIGVPGVLGVICLLLAFWGLGIVSVDAAGMAFLILGAILLTAEALTPGFGIFGVGGIASMILGLMMVSKEPWIPVAGDVVKGVILGIGIVFAVILVQVRRAMKKPVAVGREAMIGQVGEATTDIAPKGMVKVRGELWTASSRERIKKGEKIVVADVKGIELIVKRAGR